MATIQFKGHNIKTIGQLPALGNRAPDFSLTRADLSEATLANFTGKRKLLNIFPSLDTGVCAHSVRQFHQRASQAKNAVVIHISKDLPFAQGRFCKTEGIAAVETLSTFRSSFAKDYGVEILDGPLKGLCSRAVVVLDEHDKVIYTEQVPEIAQEPNYDKALAALS